MAAARRSGPVINTDPSIGEHVLRWDMLLRGGNVWRAIRVASKREDGVFLAFEAVVRIADGRTKWLAALSHEFGRDEPPGMLGPRLVRAGSGDGSTWRMPAWPWEQRHEGVPRGQVFLLTGAPGEWPTSWLT